MEGKIRGIIFDLDGTLVDTSEAIGEALAHALTSMGHAAPSREELRAAIGPSMEETLAERLGKQAGAEALRRFRKRYAAIHLGRSHLLPGAREVLGDLRAKGYRLACASNKRGSFARELAEWLRISAFFIRVVGVDDGYPPKPDPAMLLALVEEMRLPRGEVAVLGDTPTDIQAARRGGLRGWALSSGFGEGAALRAAGAERMFGGLMELLELPKVKGGEPLPPPPRLEGGGARG